MAPGDKVVVNRAGGMKQTFFDYRARHGMGVSAARIVTVRTILLKRLISYAILADIQIPLSLRVNCKPHAER